MKTVIFYEDLFAQQFAVAFAKVHYDFYPTKGNFTVLRLAVIEAERIEEEILSDYKTKK